MTRLPLKRISTTELASLTSLPLNLHPGIVCNRIGRYYCEEMNKRGKCTRVCHNCQDELRHICSGASECNISDPIALVVYLSRDEIAKIDDLQEGPGVIPDHNFLGEATGGNPFDLLSKLL